jgi:phenylacetic acid degradation operon negative regulatory protein
VTPTPKSLILDLLSTLSRGAVPVRGLVAAGRLFAIPENRLRVALARLLAAGAVERDEHSHYRLAEGAGAVSDQIRAWRSVAEQRRPWSGAWIAVHGRTGERARGRGPRALRFLGFRRFEPGLLLRPDNLAGGVEEARRRLALLGLAETARVFQIRELDAASERSARSLWDARALRASYRASIAALEASAARLPRLARALAMAESFRVGGAAIGQIVLDPLLPEPLLDASELDALVAAARRYDRLGRRVWKGWISSAAPDELPAGVLGQSQVVEAARAAGGA